MLVVCDVDAVDVRTVEVQLLVHHKLAEQDTSTEQDQRHDT
jgi:hypothetical protein